MPKRKASKSKATKKKKHLKKEKCFCNYLKKIVKKFRHSAEGERINDQRIYNFFKNNPEAIE